MLTTAGFALVLLASTTFNWAYIVDQGGREQCAAVGGAVRALRDRGVGGHRAHAASGGAAAARPEMVVLATVAAIATIVEFLTRFNLYQTVGGS